MEIEIIGICGSPIAGGNTESFLKEALKAAEKSVGVRTELISLVGKQIGDCRHCNWCVTKQTESRFCSQDDDMEAIYPKLLKADVLLLASPVYFNRLSGYSACFLDRLRVFSHSKVYGGKLRNKVGGALSVGWFRNGGIETTLISILLAFITLEMIPIASGQGLGGAGGLASEHGTGKFDPKDKLGVLKDEYGLQGARSLGHSVVEVATLLKTSQKNAPNSAPS